MGSACASQSSLLQISLGLTLRGGLLLIWLSKSHPPGSACAFRERRDKATLQLGSFVVSFGLLVILFTDELGHISHWRAIMAGSLAGMVATIVTYPTDVIKTRLIVQNRLEPSYEGILHAFYKIYHQEGLLALYRGVSPAILGAVPFSAGSFFVYINLDKIWQEPIVHFTPLQNFINGCVAAGVAQTLSFPFETVKRKMQVQSIHITSNLLYVLVAGAWDKTNQMITNATLVLLP
ncbi:PREDICTED: solute carrier family 25 member 43-like, partial [Phaethon lepturus]